MLQCIWFNLTAVETAFSEFPQEGLSLIFFTIGIMVNLSVRPLNKSILRVQELKHGSTTR